MVIIVQRSSKSTFVAKKMGEKLYEILGMESCQMCLYVKIPQLDEKMPHCHQQPAVKIEIPNDTGGVVFP